MISPNAVLPVFVTVLQSASERAMMNQSIHSLTVMARIHAYKRCRRQPNTPDLRMIHCACIHRPTAGIQADLRSSPSCPVLTVTLWSPHLTHRVLSQRLYRVLWRGHCSAGSVIHPSSFPVDYSQTHKCHMHGARERERTDRHSSEADRAGENVTSSSSPSPVAVCDMMRCE